MAKIILSVPDEALAETLVYLAKPAKNRPVYKIDAAYSVEKKGDDDAFPEFTDEEIEELFYAPIEPEPSRMLKPKPYSSYPPEMHPLLHSLGITKDGDELEDVPILSGGYATDEEVAKLPPDFLKRMGR